jgi:hypothetical protein
LLVAACGGVIGAWWTIAAGARTKYFGNTKYRIFHAKSRG